MKRFIVMLGNWKISLSLLIKNKIYLSVIFR